MGYLSVEIFISVADIGVNMSNKMNTRRRKIIKLAATSGAAVGGGLSLIGIGAATKDDKNKIGGDYAEDTVGYDSHVKTSLGVVGSTETDFGNDRIDSSWALKIQCDQGYIEVTPKIYALPIYEPDGAYADSPLAHRNYGDGDPIDEFTERAVKWALDYMSEGMTSYLTPEEEPEIEESPYNKGFKVEYPTIRVDSSAGEKTYTGGVIFEVNCDTEGERTFQTYTIMDYFHDQYQYTGGCDGCGETDDSVGASVSWDHQFG